MTVGKKLQTLRRSNDFTQQQVCDHLNQFTKGYIVTRDMYANWETDRHAFNWTVAKAFVKLYRISLDDLLLDNRSIEQQKRPKRQKTLTMRHPINIIS